MSVRRAQREIDSKEFVEWQAFSRLEPYGSASDDLRFARLAALLANINRDPKKSSHIFEPDDFMPDYDSDYREPEYMSAEETLAMVRSLAANLGGKVEIN